MQIFGWGKSYFFRGLPIPAGFWAFILLVFLPVGGFCQEDEWLGRDKFLHFGVSVLIDGVCYWTMREVVHLDQVESMAVSGVVTLWVGIGKELYDETFSGKDLAWDAIGVGVGSILWLWMDDRENPVLVSMHPGFVGVGYRLDF